MIADVAVRQNLPILVAVGHGQIFWANEGDKEVWCLPLDGSEPEIFLGYGPSFGDAIIFFDHALYAARHNQVLRKSSDGTHSIVLEIKKRRRELTVESFAADADAVYVTVRDGDRPERGMLFRLDPRTLESVCLTDRLIDPSSAVVHGDDVYIACGITHVVRVPRIGGRPELVIEGSRIRHLAASEGAIFWIDAHLSTRVVRFVPGLEPEVLATTEGMHSGGLVVSGMELFYTNERGVRWLKFSKAATVQDLVVENEIAGAITSDGRRLYWTLRGTGRVRCMDLSNRR